MKLSSQKMVSDPMAWLLFMEKIVCACIQFQISQLFQPGASITS